MAGLGRATAATGRSRRCSRGGRGGRGDGRAVRAGRDTRRSRSTWEEKRRGADGFRSLEASSAEGGVRPRGGGETGGTHSRPWLPLPSPVPFAVPSGRGPSLRLPRHGSHSHPTSPDPRQRPHGPRDHRRPHRRRSARRRARARREESGEDPVRLVADALEIGARVLDREQAGADAELCARTSRSSREVESSSGRPPRPVTELGTRLEDVFGPDTGHVTAFSPATSAPSRRTAVQHHVRAPVAERSTRPATTC